MSDSISDRTPAVIAAEINMINYQTGKILLHSAVEIGRRLKEAKALLPHGEWGKWLKEAVSFSQRTADRLMQLCAEYGPKLFASPDSDGNPNSSLMTNLTYTQAALLLGIPAEEREAFVAENDAGSMTTQELSQAIAARDEALQELNNKNSAMDGLATQVQDLKKQAEAYKQKYQAELNKVTAKQKELEEATAQNASAQKIDTMEKSLKTAETQAAVLKYETQCTLHIENITSTFNDLLKTLTALYRTDPEVKEKNQLAASRMAEGMVNMLKEWPPPIKSNMIMKTTRLS
jgi:hypothetical protein